MNKPVMNLAMAILMSFGLVACSSSSDNGTDGLQEVGVSSSTTTTKTQINNDESDSASSNTRIINASSSASDSSTSSDSSSSESSDSSGSTESSSTDSSSTESSSTDSSTTETVDTTEADSIASSLASSTFANDSSSQTYAYLQDETKKLELLDQTGKCNTDSTKCYSSTKHNITTGTVLFTDKNSYSGYAVIREEYSSENSSTTPANSYIAIVKTPTTDKSVVVDATYTGNAVYTSNNLQTVSGYTSKNGYNASLTLTVKDGSVSGSITNVKGKELVALNDSSILVGSNSVVFSGVATFNKVSGVSADGISGTYKGQFAGANAEEVVGVFETDTTVKADSVQGAFIGKKQ